MNAVHRISEWRDLGDGMEWRWDGEAKAGYLQVRIAVVEQTIHIAPNLNVDVTLDGGIVGVEIIGRRIELRDLAAVLLAIGEDGAGLTP